MHTYMHTYIHTYIHTCIHTYIHNVHNYYHLYNKYKEEEITLQQPTRQRTPGHFCEQWCSSNGRDFVWAGPNSDRSRGRDLSGGRLLFAELVRLMAFINEMYY